MDPRALVEGGAEGLRAIVDGLEKEHIDIWGAYLIQSTSAEGSSDIAFRIVGTGDARDVIYAYVCLRRDGRIPNLSDHVRVSPVRPDHPEACRVMDYAARIGTPTVMIEGVFWDGLFIEEAIVVKWFAQAHVAA